MIDWNWITIWTAFGAIASFGVCLLTYITIRHIKSDSKIRDQIERANSRAYIDISLTSPIGAVFRDGNLYVNASVQFWNQGKTPARDVEFHMILTTRSLGEPIDDLYSPPLIRNPVFVAPNAPIQKYSEEIFSAALYSKLLDSNSTLVLSLIGRVRYSDVFGTKWNSRFCWNAIWIDGNIRETEKPEEWNNEFQE